jgi:hypothetical protein
MGLRTREMREARDGGFSVLEILVVLTCLGVFMIVISAEYGGIVRDAGVTIALQEMTHIKEAIRDDFYPDLGVIPQDRGEDGTLASEQCPACGEDDRPWYATRYLCLRNDGSGNPEYEDMLAFLKSTMDEEVAEGKLTWDRYYQKGWRGPYLEQDIRERLASDASHAFPLITTPWAKVCEELAQQAEDSGHSQEAERIRRGRYYLIIVDRDEDYALLKETARIVCFGPDGKDSGSYCKDFDQDDPSTFVTAEDLRKLPASDSEEQDEDDSYDTGDDLVVFVFGGGVTRRPVE